MKLILTLLFTFGTLFQNLDYNTLEQNPDHKKAMDSFQIMDGFQIEMVAAEPLIRDPVAMEIDEDGNWYVVEMPGYPLDLSKTGTIKKLKDTDNDGMPDRSIVFADSLTLPTGIMKWKKGVIVTDPPNIIYLEDTDGDEKADKKEVVLTGFSLSNPQHNMNTPKFGVDNWIYVGHSGAINSFAYEKTFSDKGSEIQYPNKANAPKLSKNGDGRNVRFKPETYQLESLSGETQFGHTADPWGHRFYTDNANHLFHEVIDARYIAQNKNLALADAMKKIPDHGDACEVFPITENPNHQLLTDVGVVTSSCGITYYDGGAFGENFNNVTFIAEPVHNIVHADKIVQNGATFTGKRLIEKAEFLASKDPWFRPVNFYIGPDGALYLIDYYRQIVEHPEWMSEEINNSGALYNGTDKGRIYRISKKGSAKMDWFGKTKYSEKSSAALVQSLKSNNGWERRIAQRLLFQKNDLSNVQDLINTLFENKPEAKISALWLLFDLSKLTPEILVTSLKDSHAGVRENALQIIDLLMQKPEIANNNQLKEAILSTAKDADPRVRFQWLCSSSFFKYPEIQKLQSDILNKDLADEWTGIAAIAASKGKELQLFDELVKNIKPTDEKKASEFVKELSATVGKAGDNSLFLKGINSNGWYQPAIFEGLAKLWKYSKKTFQIEDNELFKLTEIFNKTNNTETQAAIVSLLATTGLPANQSHLETAWQNFAQNKNMETKENILKLISLSKNKALISQIINLATESKNKNLQLLAINSLPKTLETSQIAAINKNYKKLSIQSKKAWIGYMVDRFDRVNILLQEIKKKNIAENDLEWPQKVGLMNYYNASTRKLAREVLSLNEDRKAVLQKYLVAADLAGNMEAGKKAFEENCASCHQINGIKGVDFGPNLSTLKSRNAHSIITEIINPNNSIADKYGSWDIELKDGNKLSGIINSENSQIVFLKMMGGQVNKINVADIKSKKVAAQSLMPNGLENALSVQALADIVSYIKGI